MWLKETFKLNGIPHKNAMIFYFIVVIEVIQTHTHPVWSWQFKVDYKLIQLNTMQWKFSEVQWAHLWKRDSLFRPLCTDQFIGAPWTENSLQQNYDSVWNLGTNSHSVTDAMAHICKPINQTNTWNDRFMDVLYELHMCICVSPADPVCAFLLSPQTLHWDG